MACRHHHAPPSPLAPSRAPAATRRLRRAGLVPGVVYGGDGEPDRLRGRRPRAAQRARARGRVIELTLDGDSDDARRGQGPAAPPGHAATSCTSTCCASTWTPRSSDRRARADRRRGRARRERGRRARAGHARAQHRGAAGRHPGRRSATTSPRMEIERHDDARRGHRARGRDAARRPDETVDRHDHPAALERSRTRSRPRPSSSARTASRGRGRRGRGRRRRRPRAARRRAPALGRAPASSSRRPRRSTGSSSAWATPGPRYAEHARTTSASRSPRRSPRAGSCRKPKKKFAGELDRGPHRARAARASRSCSPQTYMNESGRSVGPARGAFKLDLDRVVVVHDEIDLPFGEIRSRARRRPGRPQRPEVAQARARRPRLPPRPHRRRAPRLDRPRDRLRARARPLAAGRRRGRRPRRPRRRRGRAAGRALAVQLSRCRAPDVASDRRIWSTRHGGPCAHLARPACSSERVSSFSRRRRQVPSRRRPRCAASTTCRSRPISTRPTPAPTSRCATRAPEPCDDEVVLDSAAPSQPNSLGCSASRRWRRRSGTRRPSSRCASISPTRAAGGTWT